jgi:hypothetical protein
MAKVKSIRSEKIKSGTLAPLFNPLVETGALAHPREAEAGRHLQRISELSYDPFLLVTIHFVSRSVEFFQKLRIARSVSLLSFVEAFCLRHPK